MNKKTKSIIALLILNQLTMSSVAFAGLGNNKQATKSADSSKCDNGMDRERIALAAAASFAALAALRFVNLKQANDTVKTIEGSLDNMVSNLPGADGGSTGPGTGEGTTGGNGYAGSGGSGNGSGTGAPGTGTNGGGGNGTGSGNSGWGTDGGSGNSFAALDGSRMDGQLLNGPLGRSLAAKIDKSGLTPAKVAKMMESGTPGSATGQIAAALGMQMPGGLAEGIQQVATQTIPEFSMPAQSFASGNGGSAASGPNLIGGMDLGGGGDRAPANMDFVREAGPEEDPNDIYHSKSSDNLFQIVSKRIGASSERVKDR